MIPRSKQTTPSQRGASSEGDTVRTSTGAEEPNNQRKNASFLHSSSTASSSDKAGLPSSSSQNHQDYHPHHHQQTSEITTTSAASKGEEDDGFVDATTSFALNLQHQLEHQQAIPRSSPIAIVQQPDGTTNKKAVMEHVDSDSDDDVDSDLDSVERDAIKLKKKYGGTMIQTYQAPSTLSSSVTARRKTGSSTLNAPYLGSLSRSANQVLSLPPMSLAGGTIFGEATEEPLDSISTGYGSLRDSHQRGRFLDGPSSYREPTSGKIRQLDHRLRYHGTESNELSIGERLQQSRKLKESRQKEKRNDDNKEQTITNAQSSLSAMMNEASKQSPEEDPTTMMSSLGEEMLMPIKMEDDAIPTFRDNDDRDIMDVPSMLSTSMTAFEMLKMSNVSSNFKAMSLNHGSAAMQGGIPINAPAGAAPGAPAEIPLGPDDMDRRFQPLARSMSDPSPRLQQMSLNDVQGGGSVYTTRQFSPGLPPQSQQLPPFMAIPPNYPYATPGSLPHPPTSPEHDPDIDGAFGDLEME